MLNAKSNYVSQVAGDFNGVVFQIAELMVN